MRRLVPYLFTVSAAVSLLASVAALVLWPRGYATTDVFGVPAGRGHAVGIASEQGSIVFVWANDTPNRLFIWETRPLAFVQSFIGVRPLAGFGYGRAMGATVLFVPNWLVLASACAAADPGNRVSELIVDFS